MTTLAPLFFKGQEPNLSDIQQILKYADDLLYFLSKDIGKFGVLDDDSLLIEIDSANSLQIRVTNGRGYDQQGILFERTTGEALSGYVLVNYNDGVKNYVGIKSRFTDDTPSVRDDTGKSNNTRRNYRSDVRVSIAPLPYPYVNLGYIIAKGSAINLSSISIHMESSVRDYVHARDLDSGVSTYRNPHGLQPGDIANFSADLEEHDKIQHSTIHILGRANALKVSLVDEDYNYLFIEDLIEGEEVYVNGKRFVKGELFFSNINTRASWVSEGFNAGTYYIYIDNDGGIKKQYGGTEPSTTIYKVTRDGFFTLSDLIDQRVFGSIKTNEVRHTPDLEPALYTEVDPDDNKPGYTQESINEDLYNRLTSGLVENINGILPDVSRILTLQGSGAIDVVTSAVLNLVQVLSKAKVGFSIYSMDPLLLQSSNWQVNGNRAILAAPILQVSRFDSISPMLFFGIGFWGPTGGSAITYPNTFLVYPSGAGTGYCYISSFSIGIGILLPDRSIKQFCISATQNVTSIAQTSPNHSRYGMIRDGSESGINKNIGILKRSLTNSQVMGDRAIVPGRTIHTITSSLKGTDILDSAGDTTKDKFKVEAIFTSHAQGTDWNNLLNGGTVNNYWGGRNITIPSTMGWFRLFSLRNRALTIDPTGANVIKDGSGNTLLPLD